MRLIKAGDCGKDAITLTFFFLRGNYMRQNLFMTSVGIFLKQIIDYKTQYEWWSYLQIGGEKASIPNKPPERLHLARLFSSVSPYIKSPFPTFTHWQYSH